MSIKAILAKLQKGEALNDDEKAEFAGFDPDKVAAAARKEGEKKAKELEAQMAELKDQLESAGNAGKSEAEKLKAESEKAAKKLAKMEQDLKQALEEKAKFIRDSKVEKIAGKIKLVPGIDPADAKALLAMKLAALKDEELDADDAVNPILDSFKKANKGMILDESGHGGGSRDKGPGLPLNDSDPSKQSDEERTKALLKLTR